jgi:hypothetical protein
VARFFSAITVPQADERRLLVPYKNYRFIYAPRMPKLRPENAGKARPTRPDLAEEISVIHSYAGR